MERAELAQRLITADAETWQRLFAEHEALSDSRLAWELKTLYDQVESTAPAQAKQIAQALKTLAQTTQHAEVQAIADWVVGMTLIDEGQFTEAIAQLDWAEKQLIALGQPLMSAATQISKLRALAVVGRYDEALECGQRILKVFLAYADTLSAGKAQQALGNIYFVREQYAEAEQAYRAAREQFEILQDGKQLAQINNCLATALTSQHKFFEADKTYEAAMAQAQAAHLEVTIAEIECNQGCLALYRGRYDRALDYLERSRRRYLQLGMHHESIVADQEMADAYLELNLIPEAIAIYSRITPFLAEAGLQAELARALAYHGRACLVQKQYAAARELLAQARGVYSALDHAVGEASVTLVEAQVYYAEGQYAEAIATAELAEAPLAEVGAWGRLLMARWLKGEALRAQGQLGLARPVLEATLHSAKQQTVPLIAQRCYTSLGLLWAAAGDQLTAEATFKRAVEMIETMRTPLPAEEFRTAFIADKLTPYTELVRLCLADDQPARLAEALSYVERARSRALVEMMSGAFTAYPQPRDAFEAGLMARLETLREELNWFYNRLNRPDSEVASRGAAEMAVAEAAVRERETAILELTRQLQQHAGGSQAFMEPFNLLELQRHLGADTVLVEYFSLDDAFLAFVVTHEAIEVVRLPGVERDIEVSLRQFQFQVDTLRHGAQHLTRHLSTLEARICHHLGELYQLLFEPLVPYLRPGRLVIVPHRLLHYVPFHALYDGAQYVIQRYEVVCAPSAALFRRCLTVPQSTAQRAVLVGVPDERAPRVWDEILSVAPLFEEVRVLMNEQATRASLLECAPEAKILHLACHGKFRPDNPFFSSLWLSDGWLTVRDAYQLKLQCDLVTLSACETGISALAPGDELIGLARSFFSAGAPSLLVSLWTVDDEATAELMGKFYTHLLSGLNPARALQQAQCQLLTQKAHPYFWAPFVLLGRG